MNTTRYLVRTARGYFRDARHQLNHTDSDWTRYPEQGQEWADLDECHKACRRYTQATGESAVVVVNVRPTATSGIAVSSCS
jgi:hypothetical protein